MHKSGAQLNGVSVETLTKFIYLVARPAKAFTDRPYMAFLQMHTDSDFLEFTPVSQEVLQSVQRAEAPKQELAGAPDRRAPSIQDLLQRGVVFGD